MTVEAINPAYSNNYSQAFLHQRDIQAIGHLAAAEALKYLGTPRLSHQADCEERYATGQLCQLGMSPTTGFDCSGLIRYVYARVLSKFDIDLPGFLRHCDELYRSFGIHIPKGSQQRGDTVFFTNRGYMATHCGIMVNPDLYIHAPGRRNAQVSLEKLSSRIIPQIDDRQRFSETLVGFKRYIPGIITPPSRPKEDRYYLLSREYAGFCRKPQG